MRIVVAPRSRAVGGDARVLVLVLEQALERGRLLVDLGEEAGADRGRLGTPPQQTTRVVASDEHPLDGEVVVEHDDVGRQPDAQAPDVRAPDHPRGHGRRRAERVRERHAERVQVPDRLDHRQRAAREHAVGAAGDAVAHVDLEAAQAVGAVADARAGDRVRDEGHAPAGGLPDELHRLGGEVDAVDDDLHDHVGPRERRAGDARVAMAERAASR